MADSFIVTGKLTGGQDLRLDVPLPLEGSVRVTLEAIREDEPTSDYESPHWLCLMYQVWEEHRRRHGLPRDEESDEILVEDQFWID